MVICEQCGVEVNKAYLKNHWRKVHAGPAVCDHCGNVYKSSMRLRIHVRTVHQKEKNHRCKICLKRFIHKSSANLCQAKHNDERNVPCNFCDRMFHTSAQRNSHRLSIHGKLELRQYNYFCDRCEFVARTRNILQKHMSKLH
jgi:general transcription factor IIIA